jgi:hypothetical protein
MRKQFVKTENYSRFVAAVGPSSSAEPRSGRMLLLHGLRA